MQEDEKRRNSEKAEKKVKYMKILFQLDHDSLKEHYSVGSMYVVLYLY